MDMIVIDETESLKRVIIINAIFPDEQREKSSCLYTPLIRYNKPIFLYSSTESRDNTQSYVDKGNKLNSNINLLVMK